MIRCKTKKWGNSLGVIIPKKEVQELNLSEGQTIMLDIVNSENPLKELFGFAKNNKISREEFLKTRRSLESKWI
jgi:antitoxin component of MazEF toxin-antitoxin module